MRQHGASSSCGHHGSPEQKPQCTAGKLTINRVSRKDQVVCFQREEKVFAAFFTSIACEPALGVLIYKAAKESTTRMSLLELA
jgi:hypothetical protein